MKMRVYRKGRGRFTGSSDESAAPYALLRSGDAFVFRCVTFADFKSALFERFSSGGGVILYEVSLDCGARSCERLMKEFGDRVGVLRFLSEYKLKEGWFKMSLDSFDAELCSGRIVCEGVFEAKGFRSDKPSCFFTKGFLKGFLTTLYAKEVSVEEVSCSSKGDEKCVFELK
jgi:predicted hydrocarbon binding protein